ncbi:hypothetical protein MRX96_044227 [Rhipicephalus microplus]
MLASGHLPIEDAANVPRARAAGGRRRPAQPPTGSQHHIAAREIRGSCGRLPGYRRTVALINWSTSVSLNWTRSTTPLQIIRTICVRAIF